MHVILKQGCDSPELACWRDHMRENQGEAEDCQTCEGGHLTVHHQLSPELTAAT